MNISKEDWVDWQSNPVTKAFMEAIQERVDDTKDLLANVAGIDSVQDGFYRGFIWGQREIQDFKMEFDEDV